MIQSFSNKAAELVWKLQRSRKLLADIQPRALDKLAMIDATDVLSELENPPSNRLHALSVNRVGQHSISISRKWRICFVWKDGTAYNVEITNHYE